MNVRDFSELSTGAELITCKWSNHSQEVERNQMPYRWHSHLRGQLLCVQSGLVQIKTAVGTWVLPPHRAGWIPPQAQHSVLFCGAVTGYSVLLLPQLCETLPSRPRVLGLNELLQALVIRSADWCKEKSTLENQRIAAVIVDEVCATATEKLYLPMPKDPRLVRVAEAILSDPGSPNKIEQWAKVGALSTRSLRRLMLAETGLNFAKWRNQAQLSHGLALLAEGKRVNEVSDTLGYATPSNFIAMFKRELGEPPAQFFSKK